MIRRAISVLILLLVASPSWGNVTYLNKGDVAPYEGYLFSIEAEKKLRVTDQELTLCTEKNDLLTKSVAINLELTTVYKNKADLYQQHSENLSKQLLAEKSDSFLSKGFYFVLGAALTGLVAYGAAHAVR